MKKKNPYIFLFDEGMNSPDKDRLADWQKDTHK